jgi:hypothetical protein
VCDMSGVWTDGTGQALDGPQVHSSAAAPVDPVAAEHRLALAAGSLHCSGLRLFLAQPQLAMGFGRTGRMTL